MERISTPPLVPAILDAVAPVAGDRCRRNADGREIVAAAMLGAPGVWLALRVLATHEYVVRATESVEPRAHAYRGLGPDEESAE